MHDRLFRIRLRGGIFALGCLALLALGACKDSTGSGPAPAPVVSSLSQPEAEAGSAGFTLTVTGSGFQQRSVVRWDTAALATTYVNATTLTAGVSAARLQEGGIVGVTVSTPAPGGGTSAVLPFTVRFPVPALTGLATDTARAGRAPAPVVVTGTGFTPGTVVLWSGAARPTTYVSATQLSFVPDVAAPGARQVTVRNPAPGGGTSAGLPFTVYNPVPAITLLPSRGGAAGAPGYALTIHGTDFVPGAVATWNGADRPTTYVGPTRVEVSLSAADLAAPGTSGLRVRNPDPGSAVSASVPFTVRALGAATATITRVPLEGVRDLVWDPGTARLYAAVTAGDRADQVVAVDPAAGAVTAGVPVGAYPRLLARSDDGQFLYVALRDGQSYRRITLASLTVGPAWPLGTSAQPLYPADMEAVPGQPNAVAISRGGAGVAIYDAGVARPLVTESGSEVRSMVFLDSPGTLYGFN
ncbi:MAG TPA: IPT/TIG domain-containing protein, partial [Longimicrobium sp.]|nr:IPT/TIG domain-containing protein [Longimicrobium sp.]